MSQQQKLFLEHCSLYTNYGFTVVALACNNRIGKLCAIRKSDYPRRLGMLLKLMSACWNKEIYSAPKGEVDAKKEPSANNGKNAANVFFVVEFYNVVSLPSYFLEKAVPVWDPVLESVTWVGNIACVTASDGSVLTFSPFSHVVNRYQLSASSIIASAPMSADRLALGTESGEVLIAHYSNEFSANEMASDDSAAHTQRKGATMRVVQRLKLSVDEQLICLATNKLDASMVTVGAVNCIIIYDLNKPGQVQRIAVPHSRKNVVIWSMVCVDKFLFTGDSVGTVSIYNAKSGAFLKSINAHQNAVLAMATNGVSVFTAGVDQRLQVISGIQSKQSRGFATQGTRYDWALVGQRLKHSNDVSALACIGERWLASGGAEHDILISDRQMNVAFPILKPACFRAIPGDGDDCSLLLLKYPHGIQVWRQPDMSLYLSEQVAKSSTPNERDNILQFDASQTGSGLKKLIQINTVEDVFISHAGISPNGAFIAFCSNRAVKVFRLNASSLVENSSKTEATPRPKRTKSTAVASTTPALVKYWDSELSEFEADSTAMDVDDAIPSPAKHSFIVSALLMQDDEMYISESDFCLWRLSFKTSGRQIRPKPFVEKKGAGQILKLCANPTKTFLLALTTNAEVLRIGSASSEHAEDENANHNEDENSNVIQALKFNYSAFDCAFISESVALLSCSQLHAQLVFLDVTTDTVLKVLTRDHLRVGYHQFVSAMSDVLDDHVFVVTNKGKVRALSGLMKVQPVMHIKEKADDFTLEARRDGRKRELLSEFCRNEPFWGFSIAAPAHHPSRQRGRLSSTMKKLKDAQTNEAEQIPTRTMLLVKHVPLAPPSQAPMFKRGFEIN